MAEARADGASFPSGFSEYFLNEPSTAQPGDDWREGMADPDGGITSRLEGGDGLNGPYVEYADEDYPRTDERHASDGNDQRGGY